MESAAPPSSIAATASIDEPCRRLAWDSDLFGRRIARMQGNTLTADEAAAALDWCSNHEIECLYFLAVSGDASTIRIAEESGFHLVDVRITFERPLDNPPPLPGHVRKAEPADLPALQRIARSSFSGTRFYNDPHFDRARCDELYVRWTAQSVEGYADRVIVADHNGAAAGYITCSLSPALVGSIGLVAVDSEQRSSGVGQRLVDAALHYFAGQGMEKASVVTQGNNLKSQRLYQRCGFVTQSLELWYHRWFSASSEKN
jgi:ribosomal protein S18 acetylase RimI-like enzyme